MVLSLKEDAGNWIKSVFDDSFTKILLNGSNFTKKQLEIVLIDILAENLSGSRLTYEAKAQLISYKKSLTRGSFNRTLQQARKNIIKSVYTILLLGYLGIFESPNLSPYIEIANKIEKYLDSYKNVYDRKDLMKEQIRILSVLKEELEAGLQNLSNPLSLAKKKGE